MRVLVTRSLAGALALAAAVAVLAPASAGASVSARQTVKRSIDATKSATSLTFVGAITQNKVLITLNVSATSSGVGQGTIGINDGTATVRSVGGTVYFTANAAFWREQVSQSAATLFAGRWVSTATTSTTGRSLAGFLNSTSFLNQLFGSSIGKSTFTFAGTAKVGGQTTTVVAGHGAGTAGRMYIAASGPPYVLKLAINGRAGVGSLTFSNFNQPVNPVVPPGAVNIDTLSPPNQG